MTLEDKTVSGKTRPPQTYAHKAWVLTQGGVEKNVTAAPLMFTSWDVAITKD
jgi:hypothetical protein